MDLTNDRRLQTTFPLSHAQNISKNDYTGQQILTFFITGKISTVPYRI